MNTAAILNPSLIDDATYPLLEIRAYRGCDRRQAKRRTALVGLVYTHAGRNPLPWMQWIGPRKLSTGEPEKFCLPRMDRDGTKQGYDRELTPATRRSRRSSSDCIGRSGQSHSYGRRYPPWRKPSAVLVASIFHFGEFTIPANQRGNAGCRHSWSDCRLRTRTGQGRFAGGSLGGGLSKVHCSFF